MLAQPFPREALVATRLLSIDPATGAIDEGMISSLPSRFRAGDLFVLNDAATLPASLLAKTERNETIEVRLAAEHESHFVAVLFGAGDWRSPTELRNPPPLLRVGERIDFGGFKAQIVGVRDRRIVELAFDSEGADLWAKIYSRGRPVQYSYLSRELSLDEVQTPYAARPWAMEMPSAGRALSFEILKQIRDRGAKIRTLTHAAGLSSIGDEVLDRLLPFEERYEIPEETARAIAETKRAGSRIVAAGTTVVRALEGSAIAYDGIVRAGAGSTSLRIDRNHRRRIVDGILSCMHEPGSSHFAMLESFADAPLLKRAHDVATSLGYRAHELGDQCIVLSKT